MREDDTAAPAAGDEELTLEVTQEDKDQYKRLDLYLAANPDLREFLIINDGNEVQLAEMSGGLRALTEDHELRGRLAITDAEIETVAGLRLRGRVTTPAQYAALILSVRYIFA